MNKAVAREMWTRLVKLASNGYASQMLRNPALDFTQAVMTGDYDNLSDADFDTLRKDYEQIAYGIWNKEAELSAGDALISALAETNISNTSIDVIIDLLAEASTHTEYRTKAVPWEGATPDDAYLASARSMWEADPYDWNPKECERIIREGGIIGQDTAVRAASLIFYNHTAGRPSVNLFAGPTGSGKTEIWRVLAREFPKRVVIADASTLTGEGWRGGNKISTIFRTLDPNERQKIVLILDEFDKLIAPQHCSEGNYSDILQNSLLKLFDHDTLFFGSEDGKGDSFTLDASGISVVCLGAFQRLLEKKSKDTGSIGFGNELHHDLDYSNAEITVEDLIEFGMRAELAGRVNRITCLDPLTINDLAHIGQQEVERLSKQIRREISIEAGALFMLARIAHGKGLGARWLKSRLGLMLDDLIYDDPDAESYRLEYEPPDADERRQAAAYAVA